MNYIGSTVQGTDVEQASIELSQISNDVQFILNALADKGYKCKNMHGFLVKEEPCLVVEKTFDKYVFESCETGESITVGIDVKVTFTGDTMRGATIRLRYKDYEMVEEREYNGIQMNWLYLHIKDDELFSIDNHFLSVVLCDFDRQYALLLTKLMR